MSDFNISGDVRESFGKGAARKLRALGKTPAVIYGHGSEPLHVSLPAHELSLILRRKNAIITVDIAGKDSLVLVKDVQKDPVRQVIEHVDLLVVRKGEKVLVQVAVHLVGEPAPGTTAALEYATIEVEAEATNIPERIEVDIEGLEEGAQVLAGELVLPSGVSLVVPEDTLVAYVAGVPTVDNEDAVEAEADAEAESAAAAEEAAE